MVPDQRDLANIISLSSNVDDFMARCEKLAKLKHGSEMVSKNLEESKIDQILKTSVEFSEEISEKFISIFYETIQKYNKKNKVVTLIAINDAVMDFLEEISFPGDQENPEEYARILISLKAEINMVLKIIEEEYPNIPVKKLKLEHKKMMEETEDFPTPPPSNAS